MNITTTPIAFQPLADTNRFVSRTTSSLVSLEYPVTSAAHRVLHELYDQDGFGYRLLAPEIVLTVQPTRRNHRWKAECETFATDFVGYGLTASHAINDWQKRFATTVERLLEIRPFEMTTEDRTLLAKVLTVIDLGAYRATKPYKVRQVGTIVKRISRDRDAQSKNDGGYVVVKWEGGKLERLKLVHCDVAVAGYPINQRFEAIVTRHPITTAVRRAEAFRKLEIPQKASQEWTNRIWEKAVNSQNLPSETEKIDPDFWNLTEK